MWKGLKYKVINEKQTLRANISEICWEFKHWMLCDLSSYVNSTSSACVAGFIWPNVCQADTIIFSLLCFTKSFWIYSNKELVFSLERMSGLRHKRPEGLPRTKFTPSKPWTWFDQRWVLLSGGYGYYDDMLVMMIKNNEAQLPGSDASS